MEHITQDKTYTVTKQAGGYIYKKGEEICHIYDTETIEQLLNQLDAQNKALKEHNKYLTAHYIGSMLNTTKTYKGKAKERYEYWEKPDWIIDKANKGQGDYYKIIDKQEAVLLLNGYNDLLSQQEQDNFCFKSTENIGEFWKDELEVVDKHVSITLENRDLVIKVGVPGQMQYVFHYIICGRVRHEDKD